MDKDVQFLVECNARDLVDMMVEDFQWDAPRAMHELYTSDTFKLLEDKRSGLYYQSPVYIFDILKEELRQRG